MIVIVVVIVVMAAMAVVLSRVSQSRGQVTKLLDFQTWCFVSCLLNVQDVSSFF
jgi:type II secretory pathway pseudopilin PulG